MMGANNPNFKTGPPSEVHQLMHEKESRAHYYNDFDNKWSNAFDLNSSNSLNLTSQNNKAYAANPGASQGDGTNRASANN